MSWRIAIANGFYILCVGDEPVLLRFVELKTARLCPESDRSETFFDCDEIVLDKIKFALINVISNHATLCKARCAGFVVCVKNSMSSTSSRRVPDNFSTVALSSSESFIASATIPFKIFENNLKDYPLGLRILIKGFLTEKRQAG